jgi:AcrR family transcriptional regulator
MVQPAMRSKQGLKTVVSFLIWYTYQHSENSMQDRRKQILEAALSLLREHGLAGLTQPRVAAKTGLRQSHLTYYFPTRTDLVAGVARVGMEAQLDAVRTLFNGISNSQQAADRIAAVTVRHENTRVLAALNQAADQEPVVREVFNELLSGFVHEIDGLLQKLQLPSSEAHVDLLHALLVGLAMIDLATARRRGKVRAKAVLNLAFQSLDGEKE